jgi:hypothetical protein
MGNSKVVIGTDSEGNDIYLKDSEGKDISIIKYDFVSPYEDTTQEPPKCIIYGYGKENNNKKIYVRSISDPSVFDKIGDTSAQDIINELYLLPILSETNINCSLWDINVAKNNLYQEGDYVIDNDFLWRANKNPSVNRPSEESILWDKIDAVRVVSKVQTDNSVVWRPMTSDVIDINTTKISPSIVTEENFKEYTFYPELEVDSEFSDFVIRIDLYSMNKVDVPRVKNLRAIALV